MEYCVNITIDHYMTGMQQVHTQCDSQAHVNIFKFIIKRDTETITLKDQNT